MKNPLELNLEYTFINHALMEQALTHSSHSRNTYERLEFLGDRVLNLVIARLVYEKYPNDSEGKLAKRHAALVREDTLAKVATNLKLGPYIKLGSGEASSGGREKPSILADVLEALLGAIYLDSQTLDAVEKIITKNWGPYFETITLVDPKSRLQEYLQALGHPLPEYVVIKEEGQDHNRIFTIEVQSKEGKAKGTGSSKQAAGQEAANNLLKQLGVQYE